MPHRFFIFFVISVVMHQMGVALFRAFGASCRSITVANTFGSFFFLTIMILGGDCFCSQIFVV